MDMSGFQNKRVMEGSRQHFCSTRAASSLHAQVEELKDCYNMDLFGAQSQRVMEDSRQHFCSATTAPFLHAQVEEQKDCYNMDLLGAQSQRVMEDSRQHFCSATTAPFLHAQVEEQKDCYNMDLLGAQSQRVMEDSRQHFFNATTAPFVQAQVEEQEVMAYQRLVERREMAIWAKLRMTRNLNDLNARLSAQLGSASTAAPHTAQRMEPQSYGYKEMELNRSEKELRATTCTYQASEEAETEAPASEEEAKMLAGTPAVAGGQGRKQGANRPLRPLGPEVTTLVVRNIPARYTQEQLLEEWIPDGTFNFLFRPYSFTEKRMLGYVFVNFVSHRAAVEFQRKWHGKFLRQHAKTRALDITRASVQGYRSNLKHVTSRILDIHNASLLPVLLSGTERLDALAEATRLGLISQKAQHSAGGAPPEKTPKDSSLPDALCDAAVRMATSAWIFERVSL